MMSILVVTVQITQIINSHLLKLNHKLINYSKRNVIIVINIKVILFERLGNR